MRANVAYPNVRLKGFTEPREYRTDHPVLGPNTPVIDTGRPVFEAAEKPHPLSLGAVLADKAKR